MTNSHITLMKIYSETLKLLLIAFLSSYKKKSFYHISKKKKKGIAYNASLLFFFLKNINTSINHILVDLIHLQ